MLGFAHQGQLIQSTVAHFSLLPSKSTAACPALWACCWPLYKPSQHVLPEAMQITLQAPESSNMAGSKEKVRMDVNDL